MNSDKETGRHFKNRVGALTDDVTGVCITHPLPKEEAEAGGWGSVRKRCDSGN